MMHGHVSAHTYSPLREDGVNKAGFDQLGTARAYEQEGQQGGLSASGASRRQGEFPCRRRNLMAEFIRRFNPGADCILDIGLGFLRCLAIAHAAGRSGTVAT